MPGPEEGSNQFEKVAEGNAETIGDAQEIETDCRQQDADPRSGVRLLPEKKAQIGTVSNIQSGNESGVSGSCIHKAHLLPREAPANNSIPASPPPHRTFNGLLSSPRPASSAGFRPCFKIKGTRTRLPRAKRMPLKANGPTKSMPTRCATKANPR